MYRRTVEYYIYDNWTHYIATIHTEKCGYCNEGEGVQTRSSNKHGHWLGPFKDVETAQLAAIKTKRKTISKCHHCFYRKIKSYK